MALHVNKLKTFATLKVSIMSTTLTIHRNDTSAPQTKAPPVAATAPS
jgi:hypothetical protein